MSNFWQTCKGKNCKRKVSYTTGMCKNCKRAAEKAAAPPEKHIPPAAHSIDKAGYCLTQVIVDRNITPFIRRNGSDGSRRILWAKKHPACDSPVMNLRNMYNNLHTVVDEDSFYSWRHGSLVPALKELKMIEPPVIASPAGSHKATAYLNWWLKVDDVETLFKHLRERLLGWNDAANYMHRDVLDFYDRALTAVQAVQDTLRAEQAKLVKKAEGKSFEQVLKERLPSLPGKDKPQPLLLTPKPREAKPRGEAYACNAPAPTKEVRCSVSPEVKQLISTKAAPKAHEALKQVKLHSCAPKAPFKVQDAADEPLAFTAEPEVVEQRRIEAEAAHFEALADRLVQSIKAAITDPARLDDIKATADRAASYGASVSTMMKSLDDSLKLIKHDVKSNDDRIRGLELQMASMSAMVKRLLEVWIPTPQGV